MNGSVSKTKHNLIYYKKFMHTYLLWLIFHKVV